MKRAELLYKRHRFPPEIIQHAVWLYYRFNLSCRDIEDLLAERGIAVSYESIQISASGAALFEHTCGCLQPVQPGGVRTGLTLDLSIPGAQLRSAWGLPSRRQ